MDPLADLPDFGAALSSATVQAFAPFDPTAGAYGLNASDGVLTGLNLTLIQRADDTSAAGSYGMLDIRIGCDYRLDDALALARAATPGATVKPLQIDLGYARLGPGGPAITLPPPVTAPMPLGWSAADGARWTCRLAVDDAETLKGALQGGALLLSARIEFVVTGVAPRAAARASFVPATLLPQLLGTGATFFSRETLLSALENSPAGLTVEGAADPVAVAEALADRLAGAFGQFGPAPGAQVSPGFFLNGTLPIERLDWDLSVAQAAPRAFALRMDSLSGLSNLDPASLVSELTIPALDLGFREVALAANLPPHRSGAPAIGARISAPPAPPNRPSGINQTVVFTPPDDGGRVTLRFDPDETFACQITPFAVLVAGAQVHSLDGTSQACSGPWVELQAGDFPLSFSHITASDRLLAQAQLTATLTYGFQGQTASLPIALVAGAADIAVAIPAGATGARLALTATPTGGGAPATIACAAGRVLLDLASFPAYGPHRIAVHCDFAGGEPPLQLEFAADQGTGGGPVTLAPSAPDATWGYVTASPFRPGYRYRPAGGTWSALLAPGVPLRIRPDGAMEATGDDPPAPPAAFEIDGVQLTADANSSAILRYLPAAPVPELDAAGKPTLRILRNSQTASLNLGARFDLPQGGAAALLAKIAAKYPSLAAVQLQPAAISIKGVSVSLADDSGAKSSIGTATSSAFPPFAVVFAIPLSADQTAQAISALGGRAGLLSVDYTIAAFGDDTPFVRSADIATWFNGDGLNHVSVVS